MTRRETSSPGSQLPIPGMAKLGPSSKWEECTSVSKQGVHGALSWWLGHDSHLASSGLLYSTQSKCRCCLAISGYHACSSTLSRPQHVPL